MVKEGIDQRTALNCFRLNLTDPVVVSLCFRRDGGGDPSVCRTHRKKTKTSWSGSDHNVAMGAHLVRSYVTNPDTEPDPLKPAGFAPDLGFAERKERGKCTDRGFILKIRVKLLLFTNSDMPGSLKYTKK